MYTIEDVVHSMTWPSLVVGVYTLLSAFYYDVAVTGRRNLCAGLPPNSDSPTQADAPI